MTHAPSYGSRDSVSILPPSVSIRVELEAVAPTVYLDCTSDAEEERLHDWLRTHPLLLSLIGQAVEIIDAAAA